MAWIHLSHCFTLKILRVPLMFPCNTFFPSNPSSRGTGLGWCTASLLYLVFSQLVVGSWASNWYFECSADKAMQVWEAGFVWGLDLAFHSGPGLHSSLLQTGKRYQSWVGKISSVTDHPAGVMQHLSSHLCPACSCWGCELFLSRL